jgi:hypothetical protein
MTIDQAVPTLILFGAASVAALHPGWPSCLTFVAALALYGAMRFLERNRADEIGSFRTELDNLRSKVSDLAMRGGGL